MMEKQGKRFYDTDTGKYFRERRGKLVEIPAEWVGQVPSKKTIRDRPSKSHKSRKRGNTLSLEEDYSE